jgi:hypothetical protein
MKTWDNSKEGNRKFPSGNWLETGQLAAHSSSAN